MRKINKLLSLTLFSVVATQSMAMQVILQSQDGQDFKVDYDVVKLSKTIENLVEDSGVEDPIPLPHIEGKTLSKIIEFMLVEREKPSDSTRALYERVHGLWSNAAIPDLLRIVNAVNFLDMTRKKTNDILRAVLKVYGNRIFSNHEILRASSNYDSYKQENLTLAGDLRKIVLMQSFDDIDRVFVSTTRDRRIDVINEIDLVIAQIVTYIARNNIPRKQQLPKSMLKALERVELADKIHFGPMPTEFATWPAHCPLASDSAYDMYSDGTPDERFLDNGDGTVTDICTKLTWEQTPSSGKRGWELAKFHCETLTKSDFTNWRVPTRIESLALMDYTRKEPAMNPIFHEAGHFWSSDPLRPDSDQQFILNFRWGESEYSIPPPMNVSRERVRCVQGNKGGSQTSGAIKHYSAAQEVVSDNFTGQQWQRNISNERPTHPEAQTFCHKITFGKKTDWRLPTVKELSMELGLDSDKPSAEFPATSEVDFWSSTLAVDNDNYAWFVSEEGGINSASRTTENAVRCVR